MNEDLGGETAACISDFRRRHILVLGDAILDEYLHGDSNRISPEAPVPVLKVGSSRRVLGGAANTAANIVSLGGHATLVALVGNDESGRTLTQCALDAGIDLQAIDHGLATLRKTRVVARQQQIVRLDYEDVLPSSQVVESEILQKFEAGLKRCDVVVISDYAKGFLSPQLSQAVISMARRAGRQIIIDPRPEHRSYYLGCDYLTPNWRESRGLLGLPDAEPSPGSVATVARLVASELRTNVVLTLGPHGMSFCSKDGTEQFAVPTLAREVFDVSGAGDTVVAAFALARACHADHETAVAVANRAASVVVGKFGTATVTAEELLQEIHAPRLIPRHALKQLGRMLRAKGKRIVATSGSFHLLHNGHLQMLRNARERGDVLIVGVKSDVSMRCDTDCEQPIPPEHDRAEMVLALRMVDYVHVFDEANPMAFLEELSPDLHVDGSAYGENQVQKRSMQHSGGGVE